MERIDDMEGEGNAYDFGARIYNPRIARWMSCDGLEAKHPGLSPYIYVNNNPILYVDKDGNDFGITIDHTASNPTIILTANFYTIDKKSTQEAEKAVANWNSLSGTKVIVDGKEFTVKVQLNVNPNLEGSTNSNLSFTKAHELSSKDKIGNTYNGSTNGLAGLVDKNHALGEEYTETNSDKEMIQHAGWSDGKNITMPIMFNGSLPKYGPRDIENSVEHEIGHNLGLDEHLGDGAMKPYEPNTPNQSDLVQIINNAFTKNTGNAKVNIQQNVQIGHENEFDYNIRSKVVKLKE